ncbi:MAG: helix-hairpin-helix domain-containing protein [Bacteroidota bacterium]
MLRESNEKVIADLMERLIENNEAEIDYTDLQEQLEQYNKNKINLNKASREQLQRLFFLDDKQINALINHRKNFGEYLTLYELQGIDALDDLTVYYLTYFVTVDENWQDDQTPFLKMLQKGKHEMIALYDRDLQRRSGYDPQRRSDGRTYYLGDPNREVLRYRFSYGSRLNVGFTGEKDMGEQFATGGQQYGFDFNSFHFYYRPGKGVIKTIALGDYQVNFGQGLTFGSGIAARKSAFVMNVRRSYLPIRPYRSLNENEFMRGAAVTLGKKRWQLVLFSSAKYISTNFNAEDTLLQGDDIFSSISLTGLHRTTGEAAKRHNVFQQIYGGNARWQFKNGHIGFTHARTHYDIAFLPGDKPYQRYNFSGKDLSNTGVDYNLQWRNTSFFGEFARSSNNAFAMVAGIIVSLDVNLDVVMMYRNYAKNYQVTFNNAFGENTDGRNEHGLYTGASLRLSRRVILNTYFDVYKSNWLRYLTDGPSHGFDFLSELQYNPSRSAQLYVRYRQEKKAKNQSENSTVTDYLSDQARSTYRFNAQYKISLSLAAKSRVEVVTFSDAISKDQAGALLFQDISWSTPQKKISFIFRIAYFTVDDYNARVYAAENDVLYQYAVPLYQHSGTRYYIVARYHITRRLEFWLKFSETKYSNVNTISSGLEQVNGNTLSDIRLQVRWIL